MCVCVKGTEPCGIELRLVPSDFIALHRVRGVAKLINASKYSRTSVIRTLRITEVFTLGRFVNISHEINF